jgi:thiol-disulfide isomerase/thioredoxin
VFLNFWRTDCPPCVRELPAFQQFVREQGGGGAVVLAVNIEEEPDAMRAFLTDLGVSDIPVLLDTEGETASRYGVYQIPVTFVIDGTGYVQYQKFGEMRAEDLDAYLESLALLDTASQPAAPENTASP